MKKMALFLGLVLMLAVAVVVSAGPVWRETEISRLVPLPRNINIIPPSGDLPPEVAALSGRWEDRWDTAPPQETMLIFEKVFEESADIIYAWGKGRTQKPDFIRLKAKVIHGTKTKVKFSGSYADYTFTLEDSKTLSGICERRSGPPYRTILKKIE